MVLLMVINGNECPLLTEPAKPRKGNTFSRNMQYPAYFRLLLCDAVALFDLM